MFADLHIHSWFSDGTLSPEEIVKKAKSQNVTLISVCDHNLTDAYSELESLCDDSNIKLIRGVEIHSVMEGEEYHILAYDFDMKNKELNELLKYNQDILINMGKKLIEKISADYPSVSPEEFSKYKRNRKNGGWDSLDYLKSKGMDVSDYFKFLSEYKIPFDKNFLFPAEVIKVIHNAGGYVVLAHLGDTVKQNIEVCKKTAVKFLDMGIDGFECYYSTHISEITELLVKLCCEHNLIITAGGDDHGEFNGDNYSIGTLKIKTEQLNLKRLMTCSN